MSAPTTKEAAALQALIAKEAQAAEVDSSDKKTEYYRRQKARDFVTGYKTVLALKDEFVAENPDNVFTEEVAIELLFQKWSLTAEVKKTEGI